MGDTREGLPQWGRGTGQRGAETPRSRSLVQRSSGSLWEPPGAHLVQLRVIKEVGPVGVCLHELEFEQLPQAQYQDVVADLGAEWVQSHHARLPGPARPGPGSLTPAFLSSPTPSHLPPTANFDSRYIAGWGDDKAFLSHPPQGVLGTPGSPSDTPRFGSPGSAPRPGPGGSRTPAPWSARGGCRARPRSRARRRRGGPSVAPWQGRQVTPCSP